MASQHMLIRGLNFAAVLAALLLASCGEPQAGGAGSGPINAVATVGMVGDLVRNIGRDKVAVTLLLGEGSDPHQYRPTRDDVVRLRGAQVVFYSGLMLEGKMTDTLVSIARSGKKVYAVTERLDPSYLLEPADSPGHQDPHVWMDVHAWSKAAEVVAAALTEIDPANKAFYEANARAYIAELDKLDAYAKTSIASIPDKSRVLITAHDAFNYFGRAYRIEVLGIQGISTESEAGLKDIQKLVDVIVQRDVRAVFVESSVSEKNVRALVEGARSRGKDVTVGGQLFSDAMGAPGSYEGSYIGMIDHNITTITRALGGNAPERGMQGKLRKP